MNILHSNREKLEKYKKVIRLAIAIVITMETICIYDTPLSKDETEVESLCKAFPNAKIFISEDKVQNVDIKEE